MNGEPSGTEERHQWIHEMETGRTMGGKKYTNKEWTNVRFQTIAA